MAANKKTRTKVGTVGVDSGQLLIIDPCYIDAAWNFKPKKKGAMHSASYEEVMDATLSKEQCGPVITYPNCVTALGFAFNTYWGDGSYDVWETRGPNDELLKMEIVLSTSTDI
jgi:hypothetical protein